MGLKSRVEALLARHAPAIAREYRRARIVRSITNSLAEQYPAGIGTLRVDGRNAGFFSMVFQVLGAIDYCRKRHINLVVSFERGLFLDARVGGNWWHQYFDRGEFAFGPAGRGHEGVAKGRENGLFALVGERLSPRTGHALLATIGVKRAIVDKVSSFVASDFRGKHVVGVHYRGTDKVTGASPEATRVPFRYVSDYLNAHFHRDTYFFVATDEEPFLAEMRRSLGSRLIYSDVSRSANGQALHLRGDADGARRGEEALVDCMLLSRCDALVRTSSNLSRAASYFNPTLPVVNLTDRFLAAR